MQGKAWKAHTGWESLVETTDEQANKLSHGSGNLFDHRAVSGFGFVAPVKKKRSALGAMRVGTNPGVLVGKTPSLNCRATRVLQAGAEDAAVDFRLDEEVLFAGQFAGWVYGQRDV